MAGPAKAAKVDTGAAVRWDENRELRPPALPHVHRPEPNRVKKGIASAKVVYF